MAHFVKKIIRKAILWPDLNVVSSQTLYEWLLGCIDLYEVTKDKFWAKQAARAAGFICNYQNPDGGFNIGFQFVFGTGVWKKNPNESTTPELLSLYALYRYREVFGDNSVNDSIEKALNWILRFAYPIDKNKYAIPYAPHTVKDAHIVNGTSFTVPALAYHCCLNQEDVNTRQILDGMIRFLADELENAPDGNGKYFRYFHRGSKHFPNEAQKDKIDNYHIGQQLRYHCAVQKLVPSQENLSIIQGLSDYLISRQNQDSGVINYCNDQKFSPRNIHTWGFASCAKGFASAAVMLQDDKFRNVAQKVTDWLLAYAFSSEYFYPELTEDGKVIDDEFYVRNNAWVFHSLAHFMKYTGYQQRIYDVCRKVYQRLDRCNFCGYDIKIWNKRLITAIRLKNKLKKEKAVI